MAVIFLAAELRYATPDLAVVLQRFQRCEVWSTAWKSVPALT